LVKSLGATKVFDYNEPDVGKKINEYTKNGLKYVWSCIGDELSAKICAEALSTEPGCHYGCITRAELPRKDITYTSTILYEACGEDFDRFGMHFEGKPSHFESAKKWIAEAEVLLAAGKVKPHPISLRDGGLEGALTGLQEMKEGRYSAEKLVYKLT
jgi:NADPH:quinone reductase-like Zn-dependent oxidoreductase